MDWILRTSTNGSNLTITKSCNDITYALIKVNLVTLNIELGKLLERYCFINENPKLKP